VFDETIFPFSTLHQNARARLRKQIELLPDILKNHSSEFGNAIMRDQTLINSLPTNVVTSCGDESGNAGTNSEKIGEETVQKQRHFVQMQGHNTGTKHGVDSPPQIEATGGSTFDRAQETASEAGAGAAPSGSAEAGSSAVGGRMPAQTEQATTTHGDPPHRDAPDVDFLSTLAMVSGRLTAAGGDAPTCC
jgi:hypothetical protein